MRCEENSSQLDEWILCPPSKDVTKDCSNEDCSNVVSSVVETCRRRGSDDNKQFYPLVTTVARRSIKIYRLEDVQKNKRDDSSWAVYGGKVYDLTEYLRSGAHPGGNGVICDYLGSDLTEAFNDVGHSPSALLLLNEFMIGHLEGFTERVDCSDPSDDREWTSGRERRKKETNHGDDRAEGDFPAVHHDRSFTIGKVDFRKPLVMQIFNLSKIEYIELSKSYFCSTAVCDFFASLPLEVLTRTVWWVVPAVWIPIAVSLFMITMDNFSLPLLSAVGYWIMGILLWTLAEYLVHRFLFHFPEEYLPDYRFVRVTHFLGHCVHHVLPLDAMRLVMPPLLITIIMAPFYLLASLIFPQWLVRAVWSGVLTGYVIYDLIHYASHHFSVDRLPLLSFLKRYHMKHHYKEPSKAFGVSSPFWDYVFKTQL